jgi:predicted nicotinamide N-methyase
MSASYLEATAARAVDASKAAALWDIPSWESMAQEGDVHVDVRGLQRPRTLTIRTSSRSADTGARIWESSHVLFRHLEATGRLRSKQTFLELGSGTGFLALLLAAAGTKGTKVVATEQPVLVRNLKFNANRNALRHAVRCVAWDWTYESPPEIDWTELTLCVGADLVYYDESTAQSTALAKALRLVLERCANSVPLLLMLRWRRQECDGRRVVPTTANMKVEGPHAEVPAGRFVHETLTAHGMQMEPVVIEGSVTDGSFGLYQVRLACR